MGCPECRSDDVELTSKKDDGQGYWEKETYFCLKCGCEYEWIMEKKILKRGNHNES